MNQLQREQGLSYFLRVNRRTVGQASVLVRDFRRHTTRNRAMPQHSEGAIVGQASLLVRTFLHFMARYIKLPGQARQPHRGTSILLLWNFRQIATEDNGTGQKNRISFIRLSIHPHSMGLRILNSFSPFLYTPMPLCSYALMPLCPYAPIPYTIYHIPYQGINHEIEIGRENVRENHRSFSK